MRKKNAIEAMSIFCLLDLLFGVLSGEGTGSPQAHIRLMRKGMEGLCIVVSSSGMSFRDTLRASYIVCVA